MRRLIVCGVALVLVAGCAGGAEKSVNDDAHEPAPEPAAASATASDPPTDEYVAPKPDGTYTSSCDYILGDFTESETGLRFVADARLRNTGNVGTVTRVTARWFLAGGDEIKAQKSVRVGPGKTRRVGCVEVATQDQIDLHQALGFSQKTCTVKATIIDTFGEPESD